MGIIKQDISFPQPGGLNLDDDLTTFPKGDWRYLENMRSGVSAGEEEGQFESILTDIERTYTGGSSPAVTDTIIGGGTDLSTNKLYLLFKGTSDWIVEYDVEAKEYNIVWQDDLGVLNFNTNYKIHNVNILDGILYWTGDTINPPRKIDIAKAKNTEKYKLYEHIINVWLAPKTVQETPAGNRIYVAYLDSIYVSTQEFPNSDPSTLDGWDLLCAVTDCYPELGEQEIDVITHPPLKAPTVVYETGTTEKLNNLRGKLFQFAYRYVYLDYRKSTYSPASKVAIPQDEELTNGNAVENIMINNRLDVTVNTGSSEVLRIEVVVRDSSDLSTWYKVDDIYVYNSAGEVVREWGDDVDLKFYNNQLQIAISTEDLLRPFDYVPFLAGCQEVIEENRLTYADLTEGQPQTKLDIAAPEITKVNIGEEHIVPIYGEMKTKDNGGGNFLSQIVVHLPTGEPVGDYVGNTFSIYQQTEPNRTNMITGSYTVGGVDTWTTVIQELKDDLIAKGGDASWCEFSGDVCFWTNIHAEFDYSYYDGSGDYDEKIWRAYCDAVPLPKFKNLKSGTKHIVGIVYYERARRHGPVNVHDNLEFYLEAYNEAGALKVNERYKVVFTLNHPPPPWATHYQLVYAPNQTMNWWMQIRIGNIVRDRRTGAAISEVFIEPGEVLNNMQNNFFNLTIPDYEWQIGDRIRFIGNVEGSFNYVGEFFDFEIEGIDEIVRSTFQQQTETWEKRISDRLIINNFDYNAENINDNTIAEIYRPAKESTTKIFYEIGQKYEIKKDKYGNLCHNGDWRDPIETGDLIDGREYKISAHSIVDFTARGATSNSVGTIFVAAANGAVTLTAVDSVSQREQVLDANGDNVTGAEVEFTGYDSFKYGRIDSEQSYWVESPFYSDYEENGDMYDLGFVKVEDPDAKQTRHETKLRWGGAYYLDTELNFIAKFDYDDIETLPLKYGPIQKIIELGYVLKVLLSHKSYSFYIRKVSYLDPTGGEKLTLTNQMFGTKRPEVQDWGTQNPESVKKHERYLYFWDRSVGKFIRDAPNGMFAVSDYKMKSFFKELSLDNPSGEITCYTGFNSRFEELWATFRYNGTFTTLRFSEYKTRWDGFVNSNPDMYINILQDFFKIYEAKLYDVSSNEGQGYLDFVNPTGAEYPIIEVVGNVDPYKVKIWNAIALYSSHIFYAPSDTDIEIPASGNYPDGMKTRILKNLVEKREGVWYLPIMNDLNTPGEEVHKALNGRPMRGDVIKIRLVADKEVSEKTLLSKMIIHATPSERSKL